MWVLTTQRPLKLGGLREAISVEPGKTKRWDEDDFVEKKLIIECAAGLIKVDEDEMVKFVHGSLVDFFMGDCPFDSSSSLAGFFLRPGQRAELVVSASLSYLQFEDFAVSYSKTLEEFKSRLRKYGFLEYASKYWFRHFKGYLEESNESLFLKFIEDSSDAILQTWLEVLFTDTQEFATTSKYHFDFGVGTDIPYQRYPRFDDRNNLRRQLICMFGFTRIFELLPRIESLDTTTMLNDKQQTDLYVALGWKQWDIARKLLSGPGLDSSYLDQISTSGYGAIHLAAASGQLDIVQSMVKQGANASLERDEVQALSIAARDGNMDIVRLLISKGSNVNLISRKFGYFPLYYACAAGKADTVRALLAAGADITARSNEKDGLTAMHILATAGDEAVIRAIFESLPKSRWFLIANIMGNEIESTPLMMTESAAATKLLMEYGADPRIRNRYGFSSWDVAQSQVRIPVLLEFLRTEKGRQCLATDKGVAVSMDTNKQIDHEVNLTEKAVYLRKPFVTALLSGTKIVVDLILKTAKEYPDLDIYTDDGREVEIAILKNDVGLLEMLLDHGADPKAKVEGKTPLLVKLCQYPAEDARDLALIYTLLEHGVDINATDEKGGTALHYASYCGSTNVAKVLLDNGVDISIRNKFESTAIQNAATPEMPKLLLDYGADIRVFDSLRQNIAHFAANVGRYEVLKYILDELPAAKDLLSDDQVSGFTPLTFAIHSGHTDCVELLLPLTDMNWRFEGGHSYIHSAVEGPKITILKMVVENFKQQGLHINIRNARLVSPLTLAAVLKKIPYLEYLLDEGANPLLPWPTADLAPVYPMVLSNLCLAILTEDATFDEVIEVLLVRNREKMWMNTPDNYGNGPLHYAVKDRNKMRRLLQEDFDINKVNDKGDTALHFAARFDGTEGVAEDLVAAGADVTLRNREGKTASDIIRERKGIWGRFGA
ncbi:Ankyrin-1 [Dactylella cylindrospora]|nr:Ankyrin-1 [Dactylella cylindrospora]